MNVHSHILSSLERFARNSKLFALLDDRGLTRLATLASVQRVRRDEVIVRQGDVGDTFYLIAHGRVSVRVAEAGDDEVARLEAGMFFGEIAVVTQEPRTATVVAAEPCELICFARQGVVELLRDYPKIREVIGGVGLQRSEANLGHHFDDEDAPNQEDNDTLSASSPPQDLSPATSISAPNRSFERPAEPGEKGGLSEDDLFGDEHDPQ